MKRPALGKPFKQVDEENQGSFNFLQVARTHDPSTSHDAAEKTTASGRREQACKIILRVLNETDGLTSKEISDRCELDRHTCGRRMTDLENSKLIYRGDKRTCSMNGGDALTWWLKE